eukprot:CAMPEP_0181109278 /NCGR_PEP_ID=MMETSP1071-20121207/18091_1 /TAXON_ID=35127 /ORGANISM="Thalassiosira sp., Strain NH16" /LENGTH=811 /DNA_ID=CAMNT_0023192963 /DNA_START=107 /DNA_END=2542 /DNA_ORIENTATION=+
MKRSKSSSSSAHVAATAVLISSAIATVTAYSHRPTALKVQSPWSALKIAQFRASRKSPCNNERCFSMLVLQSSLKDSSETSEAFDIERVHQALDIPPALPGDESEKDLVPTISSINDVVDTSSYNPDQLQQVQSSPQLLNPTSVLDVTIGINEDIVTVDSLAKNDYGLSSTTSCTAAEAKDESFQQTGLDHETVHNEADGINVPSPNSTTKSLIATSAPNKSVPEINVPSIRKILQYTIPAIGIWLCSPVLSMIDTAAVGLLSGTAQQASLNPAISISDYGALVVAFMYTATTNLIAAAVQKDKDSSSSSSGVGPDASLSEQQRPRTTKTLLTALQLALVVGTVFGAILGSSGKVLLKMLVGNDDALDPAVFGAALRYVRIRTLGMPAMLVIGTAQSACLGMQDVKSPLYVLATAAAVNLLGDIFLVPRASPIFGGAAGAAWATVASQYAAMIFFFKWFTTKGDKVGTGESAMNKSNGGSDGDRPRSVDITRGIMELTGASKGGKSRRKQFHKLLTSSKLSRRIRTRSSFESVKKYQSSVTKPSQAATIAGSDDGKKHEKERPVTRGFLADDKVTKKNYISLSNIKAFLPFVIPVTTTSIGRISGYIAMSHVVSTALGTYDMAAHQIILSIFCCLVPLVDALSQVAQSFVPAIYEVKEKSHERAMALQRTTNNFRKVGAAFGALLVALVSCTPLISRFFTTDPIVLQQVNGAIPAVGLFLLANGLMCAGEGALLGQKDLKFLRNMYAIFFVAVPAFMLRLKHNSLAGIQAVGVGTMWGAFAVYNVIRTILWHLRLTQLQQRTEKGVANRFE